jgi:hypothetical protein
MNSNFEKQLEAATKKMIKQINTKTKSVIVSQLIMNQKSTKKNKVSCKETGR